MVYVGHDQTAIKFLVRASTIFVRWVRKILIRLLQVPIRIYENTKYYANMKSKIPSHYRTQADYVCPVQPFLSGKMDGIWMRSALIAGLAYKVLMTTPFCCYRHSVLLIGLRENRCYERFITACKCLASFTARSPPCEFAAFKARPTLQLHARTISSFYYIRKLLDSASGFIASHGVQRGKSSDLITSVTSRQGP